ncbi:type I-E CRISPR-associated protein Cse2/CasB [Martelella alba]|uniref:Type I-E CRISPR-associated protein Cse2/CasB n=1 Tax=Martelella alba TaxID=2590451 RepID=A0ABY2SHE8_9HYPH|nr:type I-E CRISPR-associated protein Cse2/CasB [Martelella alba]TKI04081.1 type I-E CRISPR-associated protein Cse2/CasB [Martelella alba]
MLNSDTAIPRIFKDTEAQKALTDWFAILSERYANQDEKRINGRAWRAEIKRMAPPYDAMMSESYNVLRRRLSACMALQPIDLMALALFVSVAAHIKSHDNKRSFAAQLGESVKVKDKPCFSPLRFERLQRVTHPDDLYQQLIRAVKIRDTNGVNILSLADSIFLWMREWQRREAHQPETAHPFDRNRIRWASEYLSTYDAK